jgi:nucleoside 2-deoxyribosyltransferase
MSDMPRRLYLAGPMSGYAEHNFPEFNRVAALLCAQGYEVFNPAENADGDVRRPRSFYMRRDIPALMNCEAIAALPHWQQSRGACLEMWIAIDLDMPIFNCRMRNGSVSLEPIKTLDIKALPFSRESAIGAPIEIPLTAAASDM